MRAARSEAIGLELADVDLEEGVLRARGKGSKERLVPIGRQALARSRAYLRARAPGCWSAARAESRCSSTTAAAGSRARASTRSCRATRAAPGWSSG